MRVLKICPKIGLALSLPSLLPPFPLFFLPFTPRPPPYRLRISKSQTKGRRSEISRIYGFAPHAHTTYVGYEEKKHMIHVNNYCDQNSKQSSSVMCMTIELFVKELFDRNQFNRPTIQQQISIDSHRYHCIVKRAMRQCACVRDESLVLADIYAICNRNAENKFNFILI